MARTGKFIYDEALGQVVPKEEYQARQCDTPYIQTDEMDATWHPATGEMITSKSKFRRRTKEAGCFEVGDQMPYMEKTERQKREALTRIDERDLHRDIIRTIDEHSRK